MNLQTAEELKAKAKELNNVVESVRQAQAAALRQAAASIGPSDSDAPEDQIEVTFGGPLTANDVVIMGLALHRLVFAAGDYIKSDGHDEDDFFPCGEGDGNFEVNMKLVKDTALRAIALDRIFAKLHQRMSAELAVHFFKEKVAEFQSVCKEILEAIND
mgnify:CR=1 FL=1